MAPSKFYDFDLIDADDELEMVHKFTLITLELSRNANSALQNL